jgi:hypothetical protein
MGEPGLATVTLPQHGGCLCGAVRYALGAAPLLAYACHCHDCQTRTGSAFTLTLVIRTDDLAVAGRVDPLARAMRSGRAVEHSVCPQRRVPLSSRAPVAPAYTSLRGGTLDDAS